MRPCRMIKSKSWERAVTNNNDSANVARSGFTPNRLQPDANSASGNRASASGGHGHMFSMMAMATTNAANTELNSPMRERTKLHFR